MASYRLLSVLVENRAGVLNRVASMIRRRGFNIDSLSVGPTEDSSISRMTIRVGVGEAQAEQAAKQLDKLLDVIVVDDITDMPTVEREVLLVKVGNEEGAKFLAATAHLSFFHGKVLDASEGGLIVEVTGTSHEIDFIVSLIADLGIKEIARGGSVALVRGDAIRRVGDVSPGQSPERENREQDTTGDI